MKKNILLTGMFLSVFLSCNEKEEHLHGIPDYLIFGDYYGECAGSSCIDIYKIDHSALYEDSNDTYPPSVAPYEGNFLQLPNDQYNEVKDLLEKFPEQLAHEKTHVIGIPDGGDWGGYYIEIYRNNQRQFWYIDKMRESVPDYLDPFLDDVENKLAFLE